MAQLGLDPEAVRALARKLEQDAGTIEQIRSALGGQLQNVVWTGRDSEQFREQWSNTHAPALTRVIEALREAGAKANSNAAAQEQTSASL